MNYKFRAYAKDKKIYIYDFDQDLSKKGYTIKLGDSIHSFVYNVGMIYDTLEQYVGIKDSTGKEIYLGDILVDDKDTQYKVIFNKGAFRLRILNGINVFYSKRLRNFHDFPNRYFTIIGNTYEGY